MSFQGSTEQPSSNKVKPAWLSAFPFIQQHWSVVENIRQYYPTLADYALSDDWHRSREQHRSLSFSAFLRRFRQTRLAYIAAADLEQSIGHHLTALHAVSTLADFLIQQAYQAAESDVISRYGVIRDDQGEQQQLQVFALGKLGSGELNYSSDIDLVFIFEHGGGYSDGKKSLDAGRYFNRMGQSIIQLLDQYTEEGRVYEVDMRLRPFGSVGPLSCSLESLHHYLLNEGREWERFAWMRARQVAGDRQAGERTMATIKPFIYRRHLDYSVFESLAKIKADMTLLTDYEADDLKYGLGGIRSVEFVVQSLQMTFGGRDETLQGVSIYQQIQNLYEARKLSTHDMEILTHGWLWLRKSENILQAVDDLPNHEFVMTHDLKKHMASFFGHFDWSDYCRQLEKLRTEIDAIFRHLFADMATVEVVLTAEEQRLINTKLAELPLQRLPKSTTEKVHSVLQQALLIGRQSPLKTTDEAQRVHAAADPQGFHDDNKTPDIAWQRLLQVIKAIVKRPSYLSMLVKEQPVLVALLRLLQQHDYVATTVAQFPVLLEHLFEPHDLPDEITPVWLQKQWQQQKMRVDDVEQWMEALRYFKLSTQFLIICDWLNEEKGNRQTCHRLSKLAEFILIKVIEYSHAETCDKLKLPIESIVSCQQLMVIAYGSLASGQMKLSSDMDLVFVLDCETLSNDQRHFMQRWVKRITHHLNARLYHGHLYDIDLQLRPNGNSGSLVTTLKEFADYQKNRAWIWEHAALIKSKLVYGTQPQQLHFKQLRQAILSQPRTSDEVHQALADMRAKLVKTDSGHQLEFEVMAAVLVYSHQYPQLAQLQYLSNMFAELKLLGLLKSRGGLPDPPVPVH